MIQFDRIELVAYSNKPLDSIDFDAKEALNSNSVRLNKKCRKLEIRVTYLFPNFRFDTQNLNLRISLHAFIENKFYHFHLLHYANNQAEQ